MPRAIALLPTARGPACRPSTRPIPLEDSPAPSTGQGVTVARPKHMPHPRRRRGLHGEESWQGTGPTWKRRDATRARRVSGSTCRRRRALADARRHVRSGRSRSHPHRRSEEHTSELQSPCNLVCRLLLEKKNTHTAIGWPLACGGFLKVVYELLLLAQVCVGHPSSG